MKLVIWEILIQAGGFPQSSEWDRVKRDLTEAILAVQWPPGTGKFLMYDQSGKKRGQGSGVKPIKESDLSLELHRRPGAQDEHR